ncbi:MAG: NADH-quinone oxidoreductase subunit C [Candidatus Solibacter usitatus]|nr:NADH-quinone oxidoreductase subunit C [Candidatus Solibacter usitatus]
MLPDNLKEMTVPAALELWDAGALTGGGRDFGETLLWVRRDRIADVCRHLKEKFQFVRLSGLTCIDRHPAEPRFEVLYLLHSIERNERLKLKVALTGAQPEVDSVTPVWAGANWYEREAFDLFGVRFLGHPDLKRIMMPADWEGHPLRKDFPIHGHKYSYQNG